MSGHFASLSSSASSSTFNTGTVFEVTHTGFAGRFFDNDSGNFLWNDALNWSTGVLPGVGHDVLVGLGGGATVTLDGGDRTVLNLDFDGFCL
jgi:hypothetical protein